jgi:hypothetical protein
MKKEKNNAKTKKINIMISKAITDMVLKNKKGSIGEN